MLAGGDDKTSQKVKEAMTASTRGTMRPNGRSPPFLAIGLFIALCVMGFNYWSLSAKNAEQANEISILNSEKLAARSTAEKRIESLTGQVSSLQSNLNTAKEQKDSEALKFKDEKQAIEEQCQREKTSMREELDECRGLSNELKTKVENFKCDEQKCQSLTAAAREQAFQDVYKATDIATMLKLHQTGVDLGRLAEQLKDELNAETQRQEQLARLQQQHPQPQQQQNPAADTQGLQQDKLPAAQAAQPHIGANANNNLPQQNSYLLQDPSVLRAQPADAQVVGDQVQPGPFVQPIVGNQPGDGVQREAGIQNEAGNKNEAGNPGGQLQDDKGDAGLAADNDQHVLPKPDHGNVVESLRQQQRQKTTRRPLKTTGTTTGSTNSANVAAVRYNQHKDNNAPIVGDHISPVDKEGASHNGEDNELPGDKDNMEDDEEDEKDDQDYKYEEDEDEDWVDEDKIDDMQNNENKIDETQREMEIQP